MLTESLGGEELTNTDRKDMLAGIKFDAVLGRLTTIEHLSRSIQRKLVGRIGQ